jgi:hypothetical protein
MKENIKLHYIQKIKNHRHLTGDDFLITPCTQLRIDITDVNRSVNSN